MIAGAFVEFLDQGYVYKGLKPVNWCIHDRTALAEAEVEYENHSSPSIWVRFALTSDPAAHRSGAGRQNGLGADLDHHALDHSGQPGDRLPPQVSPTWRWRSRATSTSSPRICWRRPPKPAAGPIHSVIAEFPGAQLQRTVFRHPFLERDSIGILGDHVTLEQGTGAVHTAPGHGQEDYVIGQAERAAGVLSGRWRGKIFQAEGAAGTLPEELIGKTVWEANPHRHRDPEERGRAAGREARSSTAIRTAGAAISPTIFRATEQWFIGMDRNDLRERALEAIKTVKWTPAWGRRAHLQHDRDPAGLVHLAPEAVGRADHRVLLRRLPGTADRSQDSGSRGAICSASIRRTSGIRESADELAGPDAKCAKCGGTSFRKETDILDVWFDSGVEPSGRADAGEFPALARRHVSRRRRSISRLVP